MLTAKEQHRLNTCYAQLKSALDELVLIQNKDATLMNVQHKLYGLEDTLHYVGPTRKEME